MFRRLSAAGDKRLSRGIVRRRLLPAAPGRDHQAYDQGITVQPAGNPTGLEQGELGYRGPQHHPGVTDGCGVLVDLLQKIGVTIPENLKFDTQLTSQQGKGVADLVGKDRGAGLWAAAPGAQNQVGW